MAVEFYLGTDCINNSRAVFDTKAASKDIGGIVYLDGRFYKLHLQQYIVTVKFRS